MLEARAARASFTVSIAEAGWAELVWWCPSDVFCCVLVRVRPVCVGMWLVLEGE